jgi:hypothetical protein
MVQIQDVTLWVNGETKIADTLLVILTNDNLSDSATFTYIIGVETDNPITQLITYASGVVLVDGQDYIDWDNSNTEAYQIVASKLNITII